MWSGIGAGVVGVLAILMLHGSPPRMPKLAAFFAFIAGSGVAGWLLAAILTGWGWVSGVLSNFGITFVAGLVFVALAYKFLNDMWPKAGPGQAGRAGTPTALAGFFLPIFAALLGGSIPGWVAGTSEELNASISAWMSGWLV